MLVNYSPVQQRDTTSVRQRFDIAKENDRIIASNYLNFSKPNIAKFRELSGDISFKDLAFIPLRGKKGLIGAPSTIYVGELLLSQLAADHIKQDNQNRNSTSRKRKREKLPPVQQRDTTSVRQKFDIAKENDRIIAYWCSLNDLCW